MQDSSYKCYKKSDSTYVIIQRIRANSLTTHAG